MTTSMILNQFSLTTEKFQYSNRVNAFISEGFVSNAGNTYFNAIRIGNGIIIKEDIGIGYAHRFLNGIRIYSIKDRTLIAEKEFHNVFYSKYKVERESVNIILKALSDAAKFQGFSFDREDALCQIKKIVELAMRGDQKLMADKMMKSLVE